MRSVKKIISEQTEHHFINIVVNYAMRNSMTITNIRESVDKVVEFLEDNAVLEMEGSDDSKPSV